MAKRRLATAKRPTETDIENARTVALAAAKDYLRGEYPNWWGPVADLYGLLGLSVYAQKQPDGTYRSAYQMLPGAGQVLAFEAKSDAEAHDLAVNICLAARVAKAPVPMGLEVFAEHLLRENVVPPERPTRSPVDHWRRDAAVYFLIKRLCDEFRLKPTKGRQTENELRRRKDLPPSACAVVYEAFRAAGVPANPESGVRMESGTPQTIWKNGNIPGRLKEAMSRRSLPFHSMLSEIDASVTGSDLSKLKF
jgi:hypothetical protein